MGVDTAIEFTDYLLYEKTGQHLSDLQCCILKQVWGGKTYRAIATIAGYSEGHVKDVASQLWRLLSDVLGERITKGNYRSRLVYWLKRAKRKMVHVAEEAWPRVSASHTSQSTQKTIPNSESPILDPHFIGRSAALETINTISHQGHKIIVIQGEGGLGKTTLAQHYLRQMTFDVVLEWRIAQETSSLTAVKNILDEWLRQDLNDEPGQDLSISLSRLKRHLKQKRVGILIDNLEPALDGDGQFVIEARCYAELLKLLADFSINATTLITSRDRLCEPGIRAYHYRLPRLTFTDWQQCFTYHQLRLPEVDKILQRLHRAYGGNAKAMEILCSTVQTDFNGDLEAYWQAYGADPLAEIDLNNLVISQINRLQCLDLIAYQLLCRLSCYRYQTIATLSLPAVLAQCNSTDGQRAISSLRNRSLIEMENGQYWLHPVIRAVAIERLRQSDLWYQANQVAAQYWTNSIEKLTELLDAQKALEAYYHYVAIDEYQAAAQVLLQSRHNQWQQFLPLASSLYRMGLLQPVSTLILEVLSHLETAPDPLPQVSELRNILGDIYWITGEISQAIECQQGAISTTQQRLAITDPADSLNHYYLQMLNIDSRLSLGLYAMDLWELDQAKAAFNTVIELGQDTPHQAWADKAMVALALALAYHNQTKAAHTLASQCLSTFAHHSPKSGRLAYFIQLLGQTYGQLGDMEQAETLHQQALTFADVGHYLQVKAKALTGLATIARQRQHMDRAMDYHRQSIALFHSIGAKCDLANAHVELGHSYMSLHQKDTAHEHWHRALALYSDIHAQKQVNRVEKLLG
ncbi:tetratricopeptide repeat protein [Leptolyngbyaceae cyanobacterium CCMR0082]|uniref:Tetratricopeptide repeat protein n=2 Tax=Adonisia turfae TaxID=2950184 RepID=A0A6M0S0A4_9CYAN|nr:tetratricopeptide repeat protein [Adonisia turfae]MDV3350867.1 AAA family ATPase [Leptothoe sp. LEGE 181152]NEZ58898.1 tetratricopeptide repeat protein [Adonisia turfae CCMR0081]NEZ61884.1 tetratricopeptide repeat protein [Adonisia turfae CCMR0082]